METTVDVFLYYNYNTILTIIVKYKMHHSRMK